jgi:2-oxoglutarate dehydrogenase E1 component
MTRQEKNDTFLLTSFLYGGNADYIEQLYSRYKTDPNSVDATWSSFFSRLDDTDGVAEKNAAGPSWGRKDWPQAASGDLVSALDGNWGEVAIKAEKATAKKAAAEGKPAPTSADVLQATRDSIRAIMMIRAYRMRGHLHADLDPLKLKADEPAPELDPRSYGFTEADFSRKIFIDNYLGLEYATIPEMLAILKRTYCGTVGIEFMHISDPEAKQWIQERIEGPEKEITFTPEGKKAILSKLIEAERIEIGVEVPAHAVGADQHDRAHRVARRLLHVARRKLDARALRLRAHLVAEFLFGLGPVAVERGERLVARDQGRLLP